MWCVQCTQYYCFAHFYVFNHSIPFWPKTLFFSFSKTGRVILFSLYLCKQQPHIFLWHCQTVSWLIKIAFFKTFNFISRWNSSDFNLVFILSNDSDLWFNIQYSRVMALKIIRFRSGYTQFPSGYTQFCGGYTVWTNFSEMLWPKASPLDFVPGPSFETCLKQGLICELAFFHFSPLIHSIHTIHSIHSIHIQSMKTTFTSHYNNDLAKLMTI